MTLLYLCIALPLSYTPNEQTLLFVLFLSKTLSAISAQYHYDAIFVFAFTLHISRYTLIRVLGDFHSSASEAHRGLDHFPSVLLSFDIW